MRTYGSLHPTEQVPLPPDTVNTILLAGGTAQAMAWPTGTEIVRFTGLTTAGALFNFMVNLFSTAAAIPSSGSTSSTSGSTGVTHPVQGEATFQIPSGSTGFSVISHTGSSGYVYAQCWQKGG